jgi:AAA+ ATPase superfamily predicted ATPase
MVSKLKAYNPRNRSFIGRALEVNDLLQIYKATSPQIIVIYGRRRIGKTSLIEHVFAKRKLLKFEGLEDGNAKVQRQHFLDQLAGYVGDRKISQLRIASWKEAFLLLYEYVRTGGYTVYFEELQWMANYQKTLISDLKYVWDNYWTKNNKLLLILCGSSPSFLINSVLLSKALYNRSQHDFPIKELSIEDSSQILGINKSTIEKLDAYLLVGGIPEYIKYLKTESSVFLSIQKESFKAGGFFVKESQKVFVSSLSKNRDYRRIIEYLAKNGPHTRNEIAKALVLETGGALSQLFEDLEKCEFIGSYAPLAFGSNARDSKVYINDNYLHFYYSFIKSKLNSVERGEYSNDTSSAITHHAYKQWLGYALERFCLKQHRRIASILGFSGVEYDVGPFYLRKGDRKLQIDLLFKRKDRVLTICEIKYTEAKPNKSIIPSFEKKLSLLPIYKNYSIQKILISPNGAAQELIDYGYFDKIIDLESLLPTLARL